MSTEFEHKLIVVGDSWREAVTSSSSLRQAYLSAKPSMSIRVRVVDDARAYLTIKGKRVGIGRPEYEYEIPVDDAAALLAMVTDGH
ncbi:MAG: CYTH domain-containing protein, partial [Microlunatus sp.]|nr:CYTH domain-containing protein [Microlunatus sp.]